MFSHQTHTSNHCAKVTTGLKKSSENTKYMIEFFLFIMSHFTLCVFCADVLVAKILNAGSKQLSDHNKLNNINKKQ